MAVLYHYCLECKERRIAQVVGPLITKDAIALDLNSRVDSDNICHFDILVIVFSHICDYWRQYLEHERIQIVKEVRSYTWRSL
jgi:hypothetical protein